MKKILIYTVALLGLAGCITNDIPYPVIEPNIVSLDVEGSKNVDIDYNSRIITIHMTETFDLRSVEIKSVEFDNPLVTSSVQLIGIHDLSENPLAFTLTVYDEYEWKIVAQRDVERYFTIKGQVGSTAIDPVNRRVVISVGKTADLQNIEVTTAKLGPKDGLTVYSPDLSEIVGAKVDMSDVFTIDVTAFGETETWSVYVEVVESSVSLGNINPWATEVYVHSTGIAGMENGFQYRRSGDDTWVDVPESDIVADGGSFTAHITGLEPETVYEVLAYCGNDRTDVQEFTTDAATQLPNSSLEHVSKVAGSNYYKFYDPNCGFEDGSYMFWGSGNGEGSEGIKGSASMGIIITTIDTSDKIDGNHSVCAQTSQTAGMLAAGNLFAGQFAGLVGTEGGKVNFGRPWSTRPKALKVYCKYTTGKMDIINRMPIGETLTKEDYDQAQIKIAIGTWNYREYGGTPESPVHINTTDEKTFVDFFTDKSTIANGDLVISHEGYMVNNGNMVVEQTDKWIEYTIPLEYHVLDEIPTHIVISCAASRYGDYFSGCSKSKLWLDAFELIY